MKPLTQEDVHFIKTELQNWTHLERTALFQKTAEILDAHIGHYNWTGFYFMNNEKKLLEIGPYVGAKTDHTTIPYGRGICGQVAVSGTTFEVPDVHDQDNYLACSLDTKSEIVVPIYQKNKLIGQLDIDSHYLNPFNKWDRELLDWIAGFLGDQF